MDLKDFLRKVELFDGLTEAELEKVAAICQQRRFHRGYILTKQGTPGEELFIVTKGFVEVFLEAPQRVVVNLGAGQIVGEMALVDQGLSSATVRAVEEPTLTQVIRFEQLERLFQQDASIGFKIIRNIAADLSFKLRHRNLSER